MPEPTSAASRFVTCPMCLGRGHVYADYNGAQVKSECPYCGGTGDALRKAAKRDGYEV